MTDYPGWNTIAADGKRLRVTPDIRRQIARTLVAVCARAIDSLDPSGTDPTDRMIGHAIRLSEECLVGLLGKYPDDTSCYTCDFNRQGHCLHWKADVPREDMEAGCDKHQAQGVPF